MNKHKCVWCNSDCERIPYPKGNRFICGKCGEDYMDSEAMTYYLNQRKQTRELIAKLNGNDDDKKKH